MSHYDRFDDKQGAAAYGLNDADVREFRVIVEKLKSLPSQTNPEGKALISELEAWCEKLCGKHGLVDRNLDGVPEGQISGSSDLDVDNLGRPILPKK